MPHELTTEDSGDLVVLGSDGASLRKLEDRFAIMGPTVDIHDFASAKTSGVIADGTDDAPCFQAASDYFQANPTFAGPAGSLWVPRFPGESGYQIDTQVTWWTDYQIVSNGAVIYTEGTGTTPAFLVSGSSRYPHPTPLFSNLVFRGDGDNVGAASAPSAFGDPTFTAGTSAIETGNGFSTVVLEGCHFLNYDVPIKFGDNSFVFWFNNCSVSGCNYAFKMEGTQTTSGQDMFWNGGLIQHCNYGVSIGGTTQMAARLTVSYVSFTFLRKSYVPDLDNDDGVAPGLLQFNNCLFEGTTVGGPIWTGSEARFVNDGVLRFDKCVLFDHTVHPYIDGTIWFANAGRVSIYNSQWNVDDENVSSVQQIVGSGAGTWDIDNFVHYDPTRKILLTSDLIWADDPVTETSELNSRDNTLHTGAATIKSNNHRADTSGGIFTLTVADGIFMGQPIRIWLETAGNDLTVSVTTHETSSPEVFTLADAGDYLSLEWSGAVWVTVANFGATV